MSVAKNRVVTVTPPLDTAIYASGDVLIDATKLANVGSPIRENVQLDQLLIIDTDNQQCAMDVILFRKPFTAGAKNSPWAVSKADLKNIVAEIPVEIADYKSVGNASIVRLHPLRLECGPDRATLYLGVRTRGDTPTYTADGLTFKFTFRT